MAVKATRSFKNQLGQRYRLIPNGTFHMGDPDWESHLQLSAEPRRVTLTRRFWLAQTVVTQRQWVQVMETEPWLREPHATPCGAAYPATMVNWREANEFCLRLGQIDGRQYFLPTEAQWEHACRCGTKARYCFADNDEYDIGPPRMLGEYAWFRGNSDGRMRKVGRKAPNTWGLYDMHGLVQEWCQDKWAWGYPEAVENPVGIGADDRYVVRGGSWVSSSNRCEAAVRCGAYGEEGQPQIGFRTAFWPSRKQTQRS